MSTSKTMTASEILQQRQQRKAAGLVGCITGRPTPALDFFGYRDVQIWFVDAAGRLNGDPKFNRRDPGCFCFDCRDAFDPNGTLDAELVNEGHERALYTYRSLTSKMESSPEPASSSAPSSPPQTPGFSNEPSTPPPRATRSSPPPLGPRIRGGEI